MFRMRVLPGRVRRAAAALVATALVAGAAPGLHAQSPRPTGDTLVDGGWPRVYRTDSGARLVLYQFQVSEWRDQREISAYSAVSYTPAGATRAALGTIRFEAATSVSTAERLVAFSPIRIVESHFSTLSRDQVREVVNEIGRSLPGEERVLALDRVLAQIDTSQITPRNRTDLKADPPTIYFSTTPAAMVNLDGEPIWSLIEGTDLRFAINTNWDLFEHVTSKTFYLRDDAVWLKAAAVSGPWIAAGKLPDSFKKLPNDENWRAVKASLPGKSVRADKMPKVFVGLQPAELILLEGAPRYVPVKPGSPLLWVGNTDSDVFRLGTTGPVYYLVSGRWFSAPEFTGPWTFATPSLPPSFRDIPLEHERSRVLASVPGTPQAAEAILLAQVPQTARVDRARVTAPEVRYEGEPQFVAIEQTSLFRAVNTDKDIVRSGTHYYLCYDGVWFVGQAAAGPWVVATTIPVEVYTIPPSSPVHHVTYVTVKADDDPNFTVMVVAGGYTGMMIAWGVPVWGTGFYYAPYVYMGPRPIYYPYFPCYGAAAWYNPWTGAYGRSATRYGPYGGVGAAARYNPRTGTYARGAMAWGPYGATGAAQAFNPRTGVYAETRQGANVFSSWGSTYVQRGDDWARANRYTNRATGTTTRTVRTDDGDVYAGRDGNVYRREGGTWQKYEDGEWSSVDRQPARPAPQPAAADAPVAGLERDARARAEGAERARFVDRARRSGAAGETGSYRPGTRRNDSGNDGRRTKPQPKQDRKDHR